MLMHDSVVKSRYPLVALSFEKLLHLAVGRAQQNLVHALLVQYLIVDFMIITVLR